MPTKQTGEIREFATNRLAAGQTWSNYTVRVEVTRDGKTLVFASNRGAKTRGDTNVFLAEWVD